VATNIYGDDIHLVTTDASEIYTTIIQQLEQNVGEPLYPGDERRIYGEALVAVFVGLFNKIDDAARQGLLRYARGEVLDAIGERLGVSRLGASPATVLLRFSVDEPLSQNIIIPKWTKVTADSSVYFATDEEAVLKAGAYSVTVQASSLAEGDAGNGYAAGTISTMVDLIPYISKVTNVTMSSGGDIGEQYTDEGDDRLRERIRLAPSALSTCGPEQAYIYIAKSADSRISDVTAVSDYETIQKTLKVYDGEAFLGGSRLMIDTLTVQRDGQDVAFEAAYEDQMLTISVRGDEDIDVTIRRTLEGVVKIVPLLEGGDSPTEDIKEKILEACSADDKRPLTDLVLVESPVSKMFDIELTYYYEPGKTEAISFVEGDGGAIDQYIAWQTAALGRDINPDRLKWMILHPDDDTVTPFRVDIVSPVFTEVEDTEVPVFSGELTVNSVVKGGVRE